LLQVCPDEVVLDTTLTFLHEQQMLLERSHAFAKGPALAGIDNLGHTLEWWCAEWFRRLPLPTR
jgi:hypothetical protein